MYCSKCGKQMPDGGSFCPECGAKLESGSPLNEMKPEEKSKSKKSNKMIVICVVGVLALCLVLGLFSLFNKPTINLNNYLSISAEGYNTVGKAVIEFDKEKFEADYEKKLSAKKNNLKNRPDMNKSQEEYWEALFESFDSGSVSDNFLYYCVDGSADKRSGLSNGDIITYTWECDDEYALETYGYKLKYQDIEYKVKDLEEAETFNPFDGIEAVFEGVGPNGSASVQGTPSDVAAKNLNYVLDKSSGLSNGDEVTVTVTVPYNDDPVGYCIDNYGKIPSPLEKRFTVENLDSYISTSTQISEESLSEMKKQAEDTYNADAAKTMGDDEVLQSFEYIGNYLLVNKDIGTFGGADNVFYLVYKANMKATDPHNGYEVIQDVYWYISFFNLTVDSNGKIKVDFANYKTPSDKVFIESVIKDGWATKSWYYYGYKTLNDLYDAAVTSNLKSYDHEDNIDENYAQTEGEEE